MKKKRVVFWAIAIPVSAWAIWCIYRVNSTANASFAKAQKEGTRTVVEADELLKRLDSQDRARQAKPATSAPRP